MEILGPAQPAPDKQTLIETWRADIERLVRECVNQDVDIERTWQLRNAQKADLYWRGLQWLAPQLTDQGVMAFSSIGSPIVGGNGDSDRQNSTGYVQNIYRGDGRKWVGVLGSRMPNVKAVPDDPDDEDSLHRTKLADQAAAILRAQWKSELIAMELPYHLWNFGTTFAYTPYVTDGYKYGTRAEPQVESRQVQNGPATQKCLTCGFEAPLMPDQQSPSPQCPGCLAPGTLQMQPPPTISVPEVTGSMEYENGAVEFRLCNSMTVSGSFSVRDLDEATWLAYEYDEYKYRLKKLFPALQTQNPATLGGGADSAAQTLGSQVRAGAASPLGAPNMHKENRWNYRRIWIKPVMYLGLEEDQKSQQLLEQFPDGLKITLVEGRVVDLENERMTDVWSACKPEPSQFLFTDGMGYDMMAIQDLRNDCTEIAEQTIESGIPPTFVDPRVIDVEWWERHPRIPNGVIPVIQSVGSDLSSAFYRPDSAQFSNQMQPWIQWEHDTARVGVGVIPGIYGDGYGDQETAHTSEVKKNTAMQQIISTYTMIRGFWACAYTNGVKQLAKYGSGTLTHVSEDDAGYQKLMVDVAELSETGWHFESESSFPMTHAELRAELIWMLSLPQPVLDGLGTISPVNVKKAYEYLGMTGWKSPNSDEHDKAQEIIHELLKAGPIEQQPSQPGQQPGPPQPSVPIDMFEDDHNIMAQEAMAWCRSSIGRATRISNEQGYQNVVAWGMAHAQAATPPPAPPTPLSTRLSLSGKLSDLTPEERQKLDTDANLLPGTPPIRGQLPSAPAPPGSNISSMPAPGMPPGGPQPIVQ